MNALWYYAIGFVVIWTLAFLFKDKLKIEMEGPIILRKTTRMRDFIDSVAQKSPKLWRWVMNGGIVMAVFLMAFIVYYLVASLETVAVNPQVSIVLPGVEIPGSPIYLPFGYGLIGLITVIVIHEFGHGILARVEKVKIKSLGVGLLAILPIAFVEPDDEEVNKLGSVSKLRIFAAGSIFNMMLAALAIAIYFILTLFLIPYALPAAGLEIMSVVPGSPADGILQEGMLIQTINGNSVTDRDSFSQVIQELTVGDQVIIGTDQGTYSITTGVNPNSTSSAYIGIKSQEKHVVSEGLSNILGESIPWVLVYLAELFMWIFTLNFGIGLFNLLPLKPFDGGLIFEEILGNWTSERVTRACTYAMSIFCLSLVLINLGYGFLAAII
ncbi:membrane-associated Zn-dependent protease [Methanobacterium sp. CWC-01]|uniref:site-2 protease family protein n=1 Tax=Methanobacterium aridiramus TaxID=2584467 RepID=UPI00257713FF|nr:site-2 protease family protein [Methanobacterium sp. CWC-01]WJI09548.1 membrane-associated Zn-dependent protease [Methanobacterium sp. CWC-01]